jgi:hypothetical protein
LNAYYDAVFIILHCKAGYLLPKRNKHLGKDNKRLWGGGGKNQISGKYRVVKKRREREGMEKSKGRKKGRRRKGL